LAAAWSCSRSRPADCAADPAPRPPSPRRGPGAAPAVPAPLSAPAVQLPAGDDADRVATVAAAVLPTVVKITAGGSASAPAGEGSGVIYRSDGYIITNNHVVAGGSPLEVVFADRSRAAGRLIGTDELSDLAVVSVDRDGLTAIEIGDSASLRVGELAVAVGSPFGLEGSVTAGIVSGLNRPITVPAPDGGPVPLPNVIQTDAPINPGNFGGALVGGDGRLIGINSAILSAGGQPANAGVGFAIPVNTAVDIAEELIDRGFVQHPYLGVAGTSVDVETAERLGVEAGAILESVEPGTPAAQAGLQPEDIVVVVDGDPIRSMEELVAAVRDRDVGESLAITYRRGDAEQTVTVTLAERPR
jgi:S1-C subfamily serine protease